MEMEVMQAALIKELRPETAAPWREIPVFH